MLQIFVNPQIFWPSNFAFIQAVELWLFGKETSNILWIDDYCNKDKLHKKLTKTN